jgi:hypothetical protein
MRKAKIIASDALERRSCGVMVVEGGAEPASADSLEGEDKAVIRGLAKKVPLSRIARIGVGARWKLVLRLLFLAKCASSPHKHCAMRYEIDSEIHAEQSQHRARRC